MGDLKWFACLQLSGETSWLQTKAAHCDVQSTVQNMGWRTFGAPLVAHTAVHWSCFEPQNRCCICTELCALPQEGPIKHSEIFPVLLPTSTQQHRDVHMLDLSTQSSGIWGNMRMGTMNIEPQRFPPCGSKAQRHCGRSVFGCRLHPMHESHVPT